MVTTTQQDFSYIKDLLFPGIVALLSASAAAFFSYKATYKLNKKSLSEEKELKIIDLADTLQLEINKLNLTLEKLKEDVELFNYFSLKNIQIALASLSRIKSLNERVILFEEYLRRDMIEITDVASSLVDDLFVMENYQVTEETRMRQLIGEAEKEYRLFRLNLLSQGIYIKDGKPNYLDQPTRRKKIKTDQKLETIETIFKDLLSAIDRTALDKLKSDNEKKRTLLVTRILGVQTKLRDVLEDLKGF